MGLAYRRSIVTPLRVVLLAVVTASAGVAVTKAEKFTIKWYPNVNYTDWEHQNNNSVHVGDWLGNFFNFISLPCFVIFFNFFCYFLFCFIICVNSLVLSVDFCMEFCDFVVINFC